MRILQINTCGNLSTGCIAADIAREAENQGNECVVAYARNTISDDIRSIKIGNTLDIILHGLGTRITDRHGLYSKSETKHFIHKITEYNPDIIHLHNIHGYYLNIKELFHYLKKSKKPVIWTLHDCWAFTGHCAHFSYINCEKWKVECQNCPQKSNYPASILMDNSKKNYLIKKELFNSLDSLTLVTPSNWLANLLKESFLSKNPIEVIHNGINIENFRPRKSEIRKQYHLENSIVVLGVASEWTERKGIGTFIELAKLLPSNYRIVLVGTNHKYKFDIPDNIIMIDKTESAIKLAEFYSAADIFVNPTLEDNYPTVNIEALACGTPIITYETGGSSEIINDKCGMVIEQNNIKQLYNSIINFPVNNLKKEDCIQSIANNTKKIFANKYLNLYESILKIEKNKRN